MRPVNCPIAIDPARIVMLPTPEAARVGDLVSASNGETTLVGRVAERRRYRSPAAARRGAEPARVDLVVGVTGPTHGPSLELLEARGFEVTILERAKPKLPTEPGLYLDKDGDVWRLTDGGRFVYLHDATLSDLDVSPPASVYAPFVKLTEAGE